MPATVAAVAPARAEVAKLLIPTGKAGVKEWRRIIMLREVLARPVALREPGFGAE
jgi:hypothetical protein